MTAMLKAYYNLMARFPVGVQAVQTGLLMGAGDLIAQIFVEKKSVNEIDLPRFGRFTAIGTFFVGPSLRVWYGFLENQFGKKGKTVALKKVTVDQLVFAPGFIAAVMAVVNLSQGMSVEKTKDKLKQDYPDVLINNYKLWPTVQLCNFYVVPLHYQVITVQFVAIFWNTYLSWKMNQNS